jgi:hypothetical protein
MVVLVVEDQIGQVLEQLEDQAILHQHHHHKVLVAVLDQDLMLAAAVAVVPVVLVEMDPHQVVELADLVFDFPQHLEILIRQLL